MELNGALWNPFPPDKHELRRLVKLVARTLQRPTMPRECTVSPRIGEIKGAVVRALELADEPLSLGEIRRRCEEQLGRSVNASTVKDCVHKNARGANPLFSRVGHGRYVGKLPD